MNQEITLETVCDDLFEEWNKLDEHKWLGKMPQRTKEYFGNLDREYELSGEDDNVLRDLQNLVESKVFPLYERYRNTVNPIINRAMARDWQKYAAVGAGIGVAVAVIGSVISHIPLVRTPFSIVAGAIGGAVGTLYYHARNDGDQKRVNKETGLFFEEVTRLNDAYELARDAEKIQDMRVEMGLNYART